MCHHNVNSLCYVVFSQWLRIDFYCFTVFLTADSSYEVHLSYNKSQNSEWTSQSDQFEDLWSWQVCIRSKVGSGLTTTARGKERILLKKQTCPTDNVVLIKLYCLYITDAEKEQLVSSQYSSSRMLKCGFVLTLRKILIYFNLAYSYAVICNDYYRRVLSVMTWSDSETCMWNEWNIYLWEIFQFPLKMHLHIDVALAQIKELP